tara:strand:- start:101 stop:868 length:768 start_codon:yes stop_codon:yes gene_type:complete
MDPYYSDDSVTIYHGEALSILTGLDAGSVDAVVTDPPYSSGGMFRSDRVASPTEKYRGWSQNADGSSRPPTATYSTFSGDNRDQRSFMVWVGAWSAACLVATKPGGHLFQFTDWRQLPATTDAAQLGGWTWRGIVVWDKGVGRPMKGKFRNHLEYVVWATLGPTEATDVYPSALIRVPTVSVGERQHLTQKPTQLLRALLSVVPGENLMVLDPFMGSGTTLRAAKDLGHRCIGIELDESNCEIAAERMAQEVLAL